MTDLIYSCISITGFIIISLTQDVPVSNACQSGSYIGYGLWLCSAFNLLGIALIRCFAVYFPRKVDTTTFTYACRIVPLMGWIASFVLLFPTLLGVFGQFALECKSYRCIMVDVDKNCKAEKHSPLSCYVLTIITCGILAFLFNAATFGKVLKHSRALFKKIKPINLEIAQNISKKEQSVGKMVVKVTSSYAVVYLPIILLRTIEPNAVMKYPWLSTCVNLLQNSLVIIDPLVYIFGHENYKKEAKRIFGLTFKKNLKDTELTSQTSQETKASS